MQPSEKYVDKLISFPLGSPSVESNAVLGHNGGTGTGAFLGGRSKDVISYG
jgi:hypothetical protein